jgi:hypothetical protein
LIIKVQANICTPDFTLTEGDIVDVPNAVAKKLLVMQHAASRPGYEMPAASLVTDPAERAKAKPFRLNAAAEQELDDDGWIKE